MSRCPSPAPPNAAIVNSLTDWTDFFHPVRGVFRHPSQAGESIEHLDIDLRFIQDEHEDANGHLAPGQGGSSLGRMTHAPINLPHVGVLTLRGGEFVQDSDERMECLSEVLRSLKPIVVKWLNASDHPAEQQTLSTSLVHPAIIAAGNVWAEQGFLRKLVIQGGFPAPNLSAPTPYNLTPATTPLPSPGGPRTGLLAATAAADALTSGLPALSATKPKPLDPTKMRERAQRKKNTQFALKPRMEFAFGTWGVEEIEWRFDGGYTPAGIRTIITHYFRALSETWPSCSVQYDLEPSSLLSFAPVPPAILPDLQAVPFKLKLNDDMRAYLADTALVALASTKQDGDAPVNKYARLFEPTADEGDRKRMARVIKADMLLLHAGKEIDQSLAVDAHAHSLEKELVRPEPIRAGADLLSPPDKLAYSEFNSPATSYASLDNDDSLDGTTDDDDDDDAITPEMSQSTFLDSTVPSNGKGQVSPRRLETIAERLERSLSF